VHRASLLVNGASAGPAVKAAVALGLPVGLHLNLTEGAPVADPAAVPALVHQPPSADAGLMLGKFGFRDALAAGAVPAAQVEAEVVAQIAAFRALHPAGAPPAYIDGHQHVHVLPGVAAIVAPCMARHGIHMTRLPTITGEERDSINALPPARAAFYAAVDADAAAAAPVFAAAGVSWPAAFVGFTTMGADAVGSGTVALLRRVRARVGAEISPGAPSGGGPIPGCVEWMTHPGVAVVPRWAGMSITHLRLAALQRIGASGWPGGEWSAAVFRHLPAAEDGWRVAAGCGRALPDSDAWVGSGADDFAASSEREMELAVLLGGEWR
jgi:hypothetical protein